MNLRIIKGIESRRIEKVIIEQEIMEKKGTNVQRVLEENQRKKLWTDVPQEMD